MHFIHNLLFLSLAMMVLFSGKGLAAQVVQAPDLTNRDFIGEVFIHHKGYIKIPMDKHEIRADYVEVDDFCSWVDGNMLALEYVRKLYNGDESTPPIPAQILNSDKQFTKIDEKNRGEGNLFYSLNAEYNGKFGVKYTYQIPCLPKEYFDDGFGFYEEIKPISFTLFLLVDAREIETTLHAHYRGVFKGREKEHPQELIRAKVSEEVKKQLHESVLCRLHLLGADQEVKPRPEKGGQIWLYRKGFPLTALPCKTKNK